MSSVRKHDRLEQVLYWSMLFAVAVFVALLFFNLIVRPWLPEEVAFVLGFALFYLLANRLLFGYGHLSAYLDKLAKEAVTEADKRKAYEKSGAHKHGLMEQLTHFGIATIWLDRYEPYRYTYLGIYLAMATLVIVLNLSPISGLITGSVLEGVFWGGTVVSLFVLAADTMVRWQYARTVVEPVYTALAPSQPEVEAVAPCPDPDEPCTPQKADEKSSSS
ncbi:MAG TPA: hypothetical protein EYP05_01365 [Piscirickettsiaceae bacterium]|nr:hypothetical protein [Piscirickettsiaceae bacterium]HIQ40075.1 hypothetical protein [Sulfurivirga caldicuralii]